MRSWKTAAIALLLVLLGAFGVFRWRASSALEHAQQRVRDAGYPVTYAELDAYYPRPEFGENRAEVLELAIDAMVFPGQKREDILPIVGSAVLPHRSEPIPENMLKVMQGFMLQNLDVYELTYESFSLDECRFAINFHAGPGMGLQHLAEVRNLGRRLELAALVAVLDGNSEGAAKHIIGTFDLADSLESEPVLISQLVRNAIIGMGLQGLEQVLNRGDLPADALARIQNRLVETEANRAFFLGWIGERCMWDAVEAIGFQQGGGIAIQELWFELFYRPSGLLDLDGVFYYETFEKMMEAAQLPVEQQSAASERISAETERRIRAGSISAIILPGVTRAIEADVRMRAQLRAAIAGVAAARYRAEHGAFADEIDQLVPDFLEKVPIDPYGGGPIRYRRLDNGFVAYSLANNLEDDGGDEPESIREARENGDFTFTVERKEP